MSYIDHLCHYLIYSGEQLFLIDSQELFTYAYIFNFLSVAHYVHFLAVHYLHFLLF